MEACAMLQHDKFLCVSDLVSDAICMGWGLARWQDWREQHKAECRGVLEAVQQHNLAPEALIDLILVGRTLRRRHAAPDTAKVSQSKGNALSASHAVLDAMKGCTPLADDGSEETSGDATLARLVVQSGLAHEGATVQDVRRLLAVFQCNNFGISTELLKPVASGVFPFTALLNHCCDPSCVLTCVVSLSAQNMS